MNHNPELIRRKWLQKRCRDIDAQSHELRRENEELKEHIKDLERRLSDELARPK